MKREPIGYIYMFTNRINGKKYIGQHEYKNGIDENYFGSGSIFASAKEKYGIENFKFDILCWCNSKEELDNAESYYIGFKYYTYANTGRGYNIADGGNGGSKLRGKTEEEMREFRKKVSEATKGRTFSEEHKKKLSENHADFKGEKHPMYGCIREKHPMYGKRHSEETKKKISKTNSKKVKCIEENKVFNSLTEASKWCGLKGHPSITECCQGKRKSAGKHPITGEKLHWEYVDEETIEVNLSLISNISISL